MTARGCRAAADLFSVAQRGRSVRARHRAEEVTVRRVKKASLSVKGERPRGKVKPAPVVAVQQEQPSTRSR